MQLNPRLAKLLEAYEPDRLKAILLWFNADQQSIGAQSTRLSALLEEAHTMSMDGCYRLAGQLDTQQLVDVSILNEFGPDFSRKTSFNWLSRSVYNRFAPAASTF